MHRSLLVLTLLTAPALGAQETQPADEPAAAAGYSAADAVTIDPGMTREQVVARLGDPAAVRTAGDFTYLFFANGCPRTCGMDDLVTLQSGRVTDAIFRGLGRQYTGRSSSPVGVVPAATLGARAARVIGEPTAFDAPAPTMVAPPARRALAPEEGASPFDAPPERAERVAPSAAAIPAAARPSLAATDAAPQLQPTPPQAQPQATAAPAPARAAAPARRAPVDAFRIVPVVPDTTKRTSPDTTSARP
jgi:hypothetical protein